MSAPVDCLAMLAACMVEAYGESGSFAHRGGAGVTIFGSPSKRVVTVERVGNADVEVINMQWIAPKQTSFPPDATKDGGGITIDDTLTVNGRKYYVLTAEQDSSRTVYTLNLENEEARRLRG